MNIGRERASRYLLRNGHRRPRLRHGQPGRQTRRLRRLRHARPRLSTRGAQLENKPVRWKAGQPIRVYAVDL
jgi:hypothetical protein